MLSSPPDQMTTTMPTFTHSVSAGIIAEVNFITSMERSVISSFAVAKRVRSKAPRTSDFTRRAPAMFSWSTLFSASSFACTVRKSGSILTMKNTMSTDVTASSGSIVSASSALVVTIRTRLPSIRSGARVPMRSEICTRLLMAATSLVSRTMRSPVFCRSRFPKE